MFGLFLPPQRKRNIYQAVKSKPPFQLNQYKEYTTAIMAKCKEIYASALHDIEEQAELVCEHLVSVNSKWIHFSLSDRSCSTVKVTCDVEGFVAALISLCLSNIPPPSAAGSATTPDSFAP